VLVSQARRRHEGGPELSEGQLVARFQSITILRGALAEGPALFATVIVMLTGNWLGFLGTGFGLAMLLIIFPTLGKVDAFTRDVTGRMPGLS
jgi:hypothetical protein